MSETLTRMVKTQRLRATEFEARFRRIAANDQDTKVREKARILGLSPATVCQVLGGDRAPSAAFLLALGRVGFTQDDIDAVIEQAEEPRVWSPKSGRQRKVAKAATKVAAKPGTTRKAA